MKKKIPAGKAGAGLRALKSKAPEVAKRMGYMRKPGAKGAPTAKQFRRAAKTAKK
jgi:hypothetical protein